VREVPGEIRWLKKCEFFGTDQNGQANKVNPWDGATDMVARHGARNGQLGITKTNTARRFFPDHAHAVDEEANNSEPPTCGSEKIALA
jgi:hypothetical protein